VSYTYAYRQTDKHTYRHTHRHTDIWNHRASHKFTHLSFSGVRVRLLIAICPDVATWTVGNFTSETSNSYDTNGGPSLLQCRNTADAEYRNKTNAKLIYYMHMHASNNIFITNIFVTYWKVQEFWAQLPNLFMLITSRLYIKKCLALVLVIVALARTITW